MWRQAWPTFSRWEGVRTVAAGLGTGALLLVDAPREARWEGGILFDDDVRDSLRLKSETARRQVRRWGDLPYFAAPVLPMLVDPLLVAWFGGGDAKAAINLELVALEAFSYSGLGSFVSTRIARRERPDSSECWRLHPDGKGCPVDTESFYSGHSTIAALATLGYRRLLAPFRLILSSGQMGRLVRGREAACVPTHSAGPRAGLT